MTPLPIEDALPALHAALAAHGGTVLVAPPGAGKTTRVPLALLDQPWLAGGKILIQEPRRIAARAAARRMAAMIGERLGETVGYRVRFDQRVGPSTRIEVVTDGLYLRRLQDDPALEGVGCVIFDELHERGLESDLALALTRETQQALHSDLRIIAMSATLDPGPVSELLGNAPVVSSEGRQFAVSTHYLERESRDPLDENATRAILRALAEDAGSVLVFLPGIAEIRRVQRRLREASLPPEVDIAPLYGDLPAAEQDRAIQPAPAGRRKVVLATAIAESSLTIEDVRIVVDAGEMRRPLFSPRTGMSRLETTRVSRASADQRRGRAGRTAEGVCYRLWTREQQRGLVPFTPPEIVGADLAPLALELAAWGVRDAASLAWLTPPPAPSLAQARELLRALGAIDGGGSLTPHGRQMVRSGLHPRLAHLLLRGREIGHGTLAAIVAALLGERDLLRRLPGESIDPDLATRVDLVLEARTGRPDRDSRIDHATLRAVLEMSRRLGDSRVGSAPRTTDRGHIGALVALAYPERVAQRRGGPNRFRMRNGRGALLPEGAPSAGEWIAIADFDAGSADGRIHRFATITQGEVEELFADQIETSDEVRWSAQQEAVIASRARRLGALVLDERPLATPPAERVLAAMMAGIRALGIGALPWSEEAEELRDRIAFLRRHLGEAWPDCLDETLLATLEQWLAPYLGGIGRRGQLPRVDLAAALSSRLAPGQIGELARLAPSHIAVPSGSRVRIDYSAEAGPILAVRLQEMFGLAETPRILGGRLPLTLHLLSPARRPVQVTQNLASFWGDGYRAVRSELRGRYPKHFWPEDPLAASPTARVRPRGPG